MDAEQRRELVSKGNSLHQAVLKPGVKQALAAEEPLPSHFSEAKEIAKRVMEMDQDWELYRQTCEQAAVAFLDACSLEPTPDAVQQLTEAFLPALAIMCQRGYDHNGANWRAMGWRGLLMEMDKRIQRILFNSWRNRKFDSNNAVDLINFTGYYLRQRNQGEAFGSKGDPDNG